MYLEMGDFDNKLINLFVRNYWKMNNFSYRHSKVLEAFTVAGELEQRERFLPIVLGLYEEQSSIQVKNLNFKTDILRVLFFVSITGRLHAIDQCLDNSAG